MSARNFEYEAVCPQAEAHSGTGRTKSQSISIPTAVVTETDSSRHCTSNEVLRHKEPLCLG